MTYKNIILLKKINDDHQLVPNENKKLLISIKKRYLHIIICILFKVSYFSNFGYLHSTNQAFKVLKNSSKYATIINNYVSLLVVIFLIFTSNNLIIIP